MARGCDRGNAARIANTASERRRGTAIIAVSLLIALIGWISQTAAAAPQVLDCILADIETKSGGTKFESQVAAEKRAIIVTFDEQKGELTVREGETVATLRNVTITQTSMNGAADGISLGIDRSSWRIVFQTYGQDSVRNEFGVCNRRPTPGN